MRVRGLELEARVRDARLPGHAAGPGAVGADRALRRAAARGAAAGRRRLRASSRSPATRCSSRTTRASTSPSSTARLERLTGQAGLGAAVIDTVPLARRPARGRVPRASLASARVLLRHVGASRATARSPTPRRPRRCSLALIGLAQERGARTVAELARLAATRHAPRLRQAQARLGAPPRPGVYLFHDRNEQVLYVGRPATCAPGCARTSERRQRPAVEAALDAVERIEWRVLGSELEAALEEVRLIRELRPPANARVAAARALRLAAPARRGRGHDDGSAGARPLRGPLTPSALRAALRARCTQEEFERPAGGRCRGCDGASPTSPTACATRTRRGCATGSPRSSACAGSSSGATVSAHSSAACSSRPGSPDTCAPTSSPAVASRPSGRCRRAAAPCSRSKPAWPRPDAPPSPTPPCRPAPSRSCCSSGRSCAGPRPSCASCGSIGRRSCARPEPRSGARGAAAPAREAADAGSDHADRRSSR